ncbi:MAG: hypothetical protein P8J20_12895 [Novosphingobium sp.]|nr:hypothetical protein [Novosphingobium sp.]
MIGRFVALALAAASVVIMTAPAHAAACRVTDFTDKPLSKLREVQRLSFATEMTQTEYDRIRGEQPSSANYYELIASSANIREARQAAQTKLETLQIENIDSYRLVWASDFLSDDQLRKFTDCISSRQPGLLVRGRSEGPATFHMTFTHITPIGFEKITTKLVASFNIANADELEQYLDDIGLQDNYSAKTFALQISDPAKRGVVVMRGGWETPVFLYIPAIPTKDFSEERQ